MLGAFENQDLPFEKLVGSMRADRSLDRAPFFQVMFGFPQVPLRSVRFGGVDVSLYEVHSETAKFDIALSMTDWLDHLGFSIEYKTELFDTTTIQRLLDHIVAVLVAAVTNPDQKLAALAASLADGTAATPCRVELNRPGVAVHRSGRICRAGGGLSRRQSHPRRGRLVQLSCTP